MKVKVAEATRIQIDWMVATAEGRCTDQLSEPGEEFAWVGTYNREYLYCTSWACGGPIIERENISLDQREGEPCRAFKGTPVKHEFAMFAPKGQPLIAAMRCYVASKLGDEVEVPEELT